MRAVLRRAVAKGQLRLPGRGRLAAREGCLAARAQRRGIPSETVAARLGVSGPTAHRAAIRWRAERVRAIAASLKRCEDDGPDSDTLLQSGGVATDLPHWAAAVSLEPGQVDQAGPDVLAAAHMLLRRVRRGVAALGPQPAVDRVDRIETDLRWMALLRWRLMLSLSSDVHRAVRSRLGRPPSTMPSDIQRLVLGRGVDLIADVLNKQSVDAFGRLHARVRAAVDQMLAGIRAVDPGHASARHTEAVSIPLASCHGGRTCSPILAGRRPRSI